MQKYIGSASVARVINKSLFGTIRMESDVFPISTEEEIRKIEWEKNDGGRYTIFFKPLSLFGSKRYAFISCKPQNTSAIFGISFYLHRLLLDNLVRSYLKITKILLFVDCKEVFQLDFQFLQDYLEVFGKEYSLQKEVRELFVETIIRKSEKFFHGSNKIEIFFCSKEQYFEK